MCCSGLSDPIYQPQCQSPCFSSVLLAPDSTMQISYNYPEELDYRSSQSELLSALRQDLHTNQLFQSSFLFAFPGPYHLDHLPQLYTMPADALPFASEADLTMSPHTSKRRRMSTDSASEPPSSATYNNVYSTAESSATSHSHSHSQRLLMDFPFSAYLSLAAYSSNSGPALRGSGNTFWHLPMMPQGELEHEHSPHVLHPPMLPPTDESPMDYLHPPMVQDDDSLISTYLHLPMTIPDKGSHMDGSAHMDSIHPPMYVDSYSGHDSYDTSMRVY